MNTYTNQTFQTNMRDCSGLVVMNEGKVVCLATSPEHAEKIARACGRDDAVTNLIAVLTGLLESDELAQAAVTADTSSLINDAHAVLREMRVAA